MCERATLIRSEYRYGQKQQQRQISHRRRRMWHTHTHDDHFQGVATASSLINASIVSVRYSDDDSDERPQRRRPPADASDLVIKNLGQMAQLDVCRYSKYKKCNNIYQLI